MAEPRIGCVILAAGEGRRFGGPKQVALWRGRPLLAWVLDAALSVPALDPVVVVLGAHAGAVRAAVDLSAVACVEVAGWEEGQAASLRAGVAAAGDVDACAVLLGDMPGVSAQVIAGALDRFAPGVDAVRTVYGGIPGHPVVLGRRVLERVPELRGDVGARELLAAARVRTWEAGHLCMATDIDTPEQLEVLR
ncbi:MAG TPA: nucleotidyltransferase family protein [Solirubrobacteraceae bacterium]|nr:nucleotidyltransferase family protein [Solirubrobacteraceae bacterium]